MKDVSITQQVRYSETDAMGVTYYANYLVWFEVGRNAFFRARGIPYGRVEEEGIFLPVAEVHCRILASARYDDTIEIRTRLVDLRSRKVTLGYRIERDGRLLAEGWTAHVCVDADQRVTVLPEWIRSRLQEERRPADNGMDRDLQRTG